MASSIKRSSTDGLANWTPIVNDRSAAATGTPTPIPNLGHQAGSLNPKPLPEGLAARAPAPRSDRICQVTRERSAAGARKYSVWARSDREKSRMSLNVAWQWVHAATCASRSRLSRAPSSPSSSADCRSKASLQRIAASCRCLPEVSPQQLSSTRKARHDRADRNRLNLGDFPVRQIFEFAQHDRFAQLDRQPGQRVVDGASILRAQPGLFRRLLSGACLRRKLAVGSPLVCHWP